MSYAFKARHFYNITRLKVIFGLKMTSKNDNSDPIMTKNDDSIIED